MPISPDLSICILVYNQPEDVKRLLDSISSQVSDRVEIIIRDDSTNNETEEIVGGYSHIGQLIYRRGEKQGIDKTIIYLTSIARGRFIWWMGDDDIASGSIAEVISVIDKYPDVGFIWANYSIKDTSIVAIDLPTSRLFVDRDELLLLSGTGLGFISASIMRRDLAASSLAGAGKYVGTTFVNLYIVLSVITNSDRYYFLRGPAVICHPASSDEIKSITVKSGGVIENRAFEVFGVNFHNIVSHFSGYFREATIRKVIKKSFGQTWRGVLVGWAGGWDTPKGKRLELLRVFHGYPEAWVAFVLFCMPSWLNKFMYSTYRAIKYKTIFGRHA